MNKNNDLKELARFIKELKRNFKRSRFVAIFIHRDIREQLFGIHKEILERTGEAVGISNIVRYAIANTKNIIESIVKKLANHR